MKDPAKNRQFGGGSFIPFDSLQTTGNMIKTGSLILWDQWLWNQRIGLITSNGLVPFLIPAQHLYVPLCSHWSFKLQTTPRQHYNLCLSSIFFLLLPLNFWGLGWLCPARHNPDLPLLFPFQWKRALCSKHFPTIFYSIIVITEKYIKGHKLPCFFHTNFHTTVTQKIVFFFFFGVNLKMIS